MNSAEIIETCRKRAGLSRVQLADKLGVSRQSISSIENGRCTPSLELAMDIAYLLEMPIEEIFIHENRFKQP
jgi:putative transcriptional regulator